MTEAAAADGPRRLLRPGPAPSRATRSASWPARSTRWPRTSPRSTGSAASWSPPSATSCAPRWPASPRVLENLADGVVPPDDRSTSRPRSARPSGSAPWSPTCSTCPGSTPATRRCGSPTSTSPPCWPSASPSAVPAAAPSTLRRRRRRRPHRQGRPGPAAPAGRQPARQRGPAQPAGRHGPDHAPARRRRRAGGSRSPTTGPASRPPTASAPSSGSAPWHRPEAAAAAPASASRSPAGSPTCTAAPSASSTRLPVRRAPCCASTCRSTRRHGARPQPTDVPLPSHPPEAAMTEPPPAPHPAPAPTSAVDAPPVIDPLFGRLWPDAPGPGRPVVLAALGVGVLAGLLIPFRDLGLAFFLVLLAAGGTVLVGREAPPRPVHGRLPGAGGACARCRSCCWTPSGSWPCACWPARPRLVAGVTRGRRLRGFVVAGLRLAAVRAARPALARPQRCAASSAAGGAPRGAADRAVVGAVRCSCSASCSPPPTRCSAEWLDGLVPDLTLDLASCSAPSPASSSAASSLAAAYLALNPPDVVGGPRAPGRAGRRTASSGWCRSCSSTLVFAVFLAAQAAVIFGGHDYLAAHHRADLRRVRAPGLRPAHRRHRADPARGLGGLPQGAGDDAARPPWLRGSLGLLCALTPGRGRLRPVPDARSTRRRTASPRLRLLVDVFEGWLGLVVLAVMVAGRRSAGAPGCRGSRSSAAWSRCSAWPRSTPTPGSPSTTSTATRRPARSTSTTSSTLSDDAVPVLASEPSEPLPRPRPLGDRTPSDDDWLAWNLGRWRASDHLAPD